MKRKKEGRADGTVDQQVGASSDVGQQGVRQRPGWGEVLKVFKKVKKLLKGNSMPGNVSCLLMSSTDCFKPFLFMPSGCWLSLLHGDEEREILNLIWDKVHLAERVIRLEATDTKDKDAREIPICDELYEISKASQGRSTMIM